MIQHKWVEGTQFGLDLFTTFDAIYEAFYKRWVLIVFGNDPATMSAMVL